MAKILLVHFNRTHCICLVLFASWMSQRASDSSIKRKFLEHLLLRSVPPVRKFHGVKVRRLFAPQEQIVHVMKLAWEQKFSLWTFWSRQQKCRGTKSPYPIGPSGVNFGPVGLEQLYLLGHPPLPTISGSATGYGHQQGFIRRMHSEVWMQTAV